MKNDASQVNAARSKIERETGLCVTQITASGELTSALDNGLAELYRAVFSEPPYNEKFELPEVHDIFQSFLEEKGHIFLVQDPARNMRPVAFVTSVPLHIEFNVVSLVGKNLPVEKTAYFAEEGVDESARRQGLSIRMKDLLLKACGLSGYDRVLLRTSVLNYRQISAVNKAGGEVLPGIFQDIARNRTDGSVSNDTNAFYVFDLKNPSAAQQLDRVVIVAQEKGDYAVVYDKLDGADQKKWASWIKESYPGVHRVSFMPIVPDGKAVFDGKLYVARRSPT